MLRFEASLDFGEFILKGYGKTLAEAREDLVKKIWESDVLSPYEKEAFIEQIREL